MDILKTALGFEKMSLKFYRELEESVSASDIKNLAAMMAAEEERHMAFLNEALETGEYCLFEEGSEPGALDLFLSMKEEIRKPLSIDNTVLSLLQKGIELEEKSKDIYAQLLDATDEERDKQAVQLLIDQEEQHRLFLEGLLDMERHAQEWVEDPEFSHIGEDY